MKLNDATAVLNIWCYIQQITGRYVIQFQFRIMWKNFKSVVKDSHLE
jgi:hypothetical protein